MEHQNYWISVAYSKTKSATYLATIQVDLPAAADGKLSARYVDQSIDLFVRGIGLHYLWGKPIQSGYRSDSIEIESATVLELERLVRVACDQLKDKIHRAYVRNRDRRTSLPADFQLEVDPSLLDLLLAKPTRSALDQWRFDLKVGDRIACWDEDAELQLFGKIREINRDELFPQDIRIELIIGDGLPTDDLLIFDTTDENILPAYCDRRSDAWRFEFGVGDWIGYRHPNRPGASRTDVIKEIKHDINGNRLVLLLGEDFDWVALSYLDIFEVEADR